MRQAPALLLGQALHVEGEEIHIVGPGAQPREEIRALVDVQAALHPGVAGAEIGEELRRDGRATPARPQAAARAL